MLAKFAKVTGVAVLLVVLLAACESPRGVESLGRDGEFPDGQALTFAPTPHLNVRQVLEDYEMLPAYGLSRDPEFYRILADCGGPVSIRDLIVNQMIPTDERALNASTEQWEYVSKDSAPALLDSLSRYKVGQIRVIFNYGWPPSMVESMLEDDDLGDRRVVWGLNRRGGAVTGNITDKCVVEVD